jgi:hypothetical protein
MERMSKSNMLKNVRLLIYVELIKRTGVSCKKLEVTQGDPSEQQIWLIGREWSLCDVFF